MRLSWSLKKWPHSSTSSVLQSYHVQSRSTCGETFVCCQSKSSGSSTRRNLAIALLTFVCSFLYLVLQLATGLYFFLFNMKKNPCRWDPASGRASLAHRVLRKHSRIFTPCSFDNHPGLHPSTAASALPVIWASSLTRRPLRPGRNTWTSLSGVSRHVFPLFFKADSNYASLPSLHKSLNNVSRSLQSVWQYQGPRLMTSFSPLPHHRRKIWLSQHKGRRRTTAGCERHNWSWVRWLVGALGTDAWLVWVYGLRSSL